jgi:tRNA (guanine37-N1)-methyltransferase
VSFPSFFLFLQRKAILLLNISSQDYGIQWNGRILNRRLDKRLSESLPWNSSAVANSYDIVGDIAIIRLAGPRKCSEDVGRAIMEFHRNLKTVLVQTSAVEGKFRLRKLNRIAGENRTKTIHKESGCLFNVDVEKCYFSPRLSHERNRIANMVKAGETVVNMFAGVGCFSIMIAKHAKAERVFSIDVNPIAVQYMRENVRINGVYGKVIPILGDAARIIQERLCHVADRVLMPLPEKALEYLPYALLALKESAGWIHYYDFIHAAKGEDPVEKVKIRVRQRLRNLDVVFEVPFGRTVRKTGPHWYQVVLDVKTRPFEPKETRVEETPSTE